MFASHAQNTSQLNILGLETLPGRVELQIAPFNREIRVTTQSKVSINQMAWPNAPLDSTLLNKTPLFSKVHVHSHSIASINLPSSLQPHTMSYHQLTARKSHQSTTVDDAPRSAGIMAAIDDVFDYRSPGDMYENFRTNQDDKDRLGISGDWQLEQSSPKEVFSASSGKFGTVRREFSQELKGVPYAVTQTFTLPANVEQASRAATPNEGEYTWWSDLDNKRFSHFQYKDATIRLICHKGIDNKLNVTYTNNSSTSRKQPSRVTDLARRIERELSKDTGGVRAITGSSLGEDGP